MSEVLGSVRPSVLIVCGYYDEFSGYNEVVLGRALARKVDLTVFAADRVAPVFSDAALGRLGIARQYDVGREVDSARVLHRFRTRAVAGMLFPRGLCAALRSQPAFDHVVQLSPGQIFPWAASFWPRDTLRVVIFPDNTFMWAHHSRVRRALKSLVFAVTKRMVYRSMAKRAYRVYATTPNGQARITKVIGSEVGLLPLGYEESVFNYAADLPSSLRDNLRICD